MNHIITAEEIKRYGRAMSAHIDKNTLETLITETENLDIIPNLGVSFMAQLRENAASGTIDEYTSLLLEGGYYNGKDNYLSGLKRAVAYYVQARLVKTNDNQITRFGMMQKDSEHGYRPSLAERTDMYNDLCAIADQYMQEAMDYLSEMKEHFPSCLVGRVKNNRTMYRIIGE